MSWTGILSYFVAFMVGVIAANQTQIVKNMRTLRRNSASIGANSFRIPNGYKSDRTADELQQALSLWKSGREGMNPQSPTMLVRLPMTVTKPELETLIQSMRTPHGTLGY